MLSQPRDEQAVKTNDSLTCHKEFVQVSALSGCGKSKVAQSLVDDASFHNNGLSALECLCFAFRILTRVVSASFSPLVPFFENLQWADVPSLQILDLMISDTPNDNGLMITGCYRSEEVDENSLLRNMLVSLRVNTESYNKFHMTETTVGAFGTDEIAKVIQNTMPSPRVQQMPTPTDPAALCHKRTNGSPFFEFLKMLHQAGLVLHKASSDASTWDHRHHVHC
ncbi:unnamed protein product [Cylindrotheca closterium]|uniref:Uncharacterized protein n=1 Tax=Cylindrotheca closterium TaxID=2856 RepID=A0AAD2FKK7_9STRA|nr:unnamed protein product [Cylindrotheca closterium]